MKKGGLNYPGIPPPFVGTWENQFGEGASRMGKPKTGKGKKNSRGKGLLTAKNSEIVKQLPVLETLF